MMGANKILSETHLVSFAGSLAAEKTFSHSTDRYSLIAADHLPLFL